jgi:hypothetical protein
LVVPATGFEGRLWVSTRQAKPKIAESTWRFLLTERGEIPSLSSLRRNAEISRVVIFAAGLSPNVAMSTPGLLPLPRRCGAPGSASM